MINQVMRQHHVCAIGNALVDVEYFVDEAILTELQIERDVMTLICETRQSEIMMRLQDLEQGRYCAGSAANTVRTIAGLGGDCFYSCKVAQDSAGNFFIDDLHRLNVRSNLSKRSLEQGITGTCLVLVTPDGQRTMNTHLGITQTFSEAEVHEEAIANSKFLYIEGYLVASPSAIKSAHMAKKLARQHGTRVALTLSDFNMVKYFKEHLLDLMQDPVDLLFCNEAEAKLFCDSQDMQVVCDELKKYAETFVVTMGEQGSIIFDGQKIIQLPAPRVNVHDTLGAGDVYAGCFLYAITHGFDYESAGLAANFAASQVVTQPGPRLSDHDIQILQEKMESLKAHAI